MSAGSPDFHILARNLEAVIQRLGEVVDRLPEAGIGNARVSQSVSMGGFLTGVAVACCVCSVFLALAILIIDNRSFQKITDTQRDQAAWLEVIRGKVATLEGKAK